LKLGFLFDDSNQFETPTEKMPPEPEHKPGLLPEAPGRISLTALNHAFERDPQAIAEYIVTLEEKNQSLISLVRKDFRVAQTASAHLNLIIGNTAKADDFSDEDIDRMLKGTAHGKALESFPRPSIFAQPAEEDEEVAPQNITFNTKLSSEADETPSTRDNGRQLSPEAPVFTPRRTLSPEAPVFEPASRQPTPEMPTTQPAEEAEEAATQNITLNTKLSSEADETPSTRDNGRQLSPEAPVFTPRRRLSPEAPIFTPRSTLSPEAPAFEPASRQPTPEIPTAQPAEEVTQTVATFSTKASPEPAEFERKRGIRRPSSPHADECFRRRLSPEAPVFTPSRKLSPEPAACQPASESQSFTGFERLVSDTQLQPEALLESQWLTASERLCSLAPTTMTTPSPGNQSSRRPCLFYVSGEQCPFENRKGGCFGFHDDAARHANLAKRTPVPVSNVAKSKAEESTLQPVQTVSQGPQDHTSASPDQSPTSSTTSGRTKRFQNRQCRFYVNGQHCPYQNRKGGCLDIHDLAARRSNLASSNLAKLSPKVFKTRDLAPFYSTLTPSRQMTMPSPARWPSGPQT
jgi:hypothetical protein